MKQRILALAVAARTLAATLPARARGCRSEARAISMLPLPASVFDWLQSRSLGNASRIAK
jgi:hypothetical protein